MSNQTVYDWLEWAQDKYDAAQERQEERGRASLRSSRGVAAEDVREHAPQRRRAPRFLHGERLGRRA